jgi:hypothetical protein
VGFIGSCLLFLGCAPSAPSGAILSEHVRFTDPDQELRSWLLSEVSVGSREAEGSFHLTNSSQEDRTLVFQGTSCGCTGAFVDAAVLNQGDKLTIKGRDTVQVRLRSHTGASTGIFSYRATFGLPGEKPNQDILTARMRFRVYRDVLLEPSVLSYDFTASEVNKLDKTMRITRTLRIEKPTSSPPTLSNLPPQVEVQEIVEAEPLTRIEPDLWKQSWDVTFGVKPIEGRENLSAVARGGVSFADDAGKALASAEFPIVIHRVYGIESPELSHFGDVPAGERRARKLVIRSADGRDFEILRVHTDSESFSASGKVGEVRKSHFLEAVFQATKPGAFQGHMIVETNHPECPTLTINLAATVPMQTALTNVGGTESTHKP